MDGILLIDKPVGWTSHDVVAKVRSILRQQVYSGQFTVDSEGSKDLQTTNYKLKTTSSKVKVGHTGTLDPMATGLLVLVLGKYTKRAGEFSKLDKTYEAELTLGKTSSTGDMEGEITQKSTHQPSLEEIQTILNKFTGEISQTPPQFSAIKVGGQRAYKAARAGKTVVIEPRKVKIYSIADVKYDYPILSFTTEVSSGTYIRALAEDIGQKLGTGAYLSALRRTSVGKFDIKDAVALDEVRLNIARYIRE